MKSITVVVLLALSLITAAQTSAKEANPKMPKAVHTDGAPPAKGPYSQGVDVQGSRILFLSGQTARDPKSGELVSGDIAAQTERVMENLKAVLLAAGLDFSNVVRCTVFLTDMAEFKGAKVEIDAIAVR